MTLCFIHILSVLTHSFYGRALCFNTLQLHTDITTVLLLTEKGIKESVNVRIRKSQPCSIFVCTAFVTINFNLLYSVVYDFS